MADHYRLMVPGAAPGPVPVEVHAPYDGQLIATVDAGGETAVDQALATAYGLYRDRDAWIPLAQRIEILHKAAGLMRERAEHLALEAAREGGKPLIDSRVEVARAIDGVLNCAELLRSEAGHVIPMNINAASANRIAFTTFEPIGVVVAVSAFNHPLNLIVHQVAPGIAAGCPVIVKPAEATPLSCFRFVAILREAGLPEAWCQALVTDGKEATGRLVTDARVGFFSFIGSAAVGWMLRSKLAPGARCALEHGGAAPVIVAPDADLGIALPKIAKGGFYHAGQVCVSVQRVYAHRSVVAQVTEGLAQQARGMRVGDPLLPETEVGPLIRPGEVKRVHDWVSEAVEKGARLVCGGTPLSETCYPPTVLLAPPADCRVSTQEIFGPVVCVYAYDDLDEAIGRTNALPYSFQAAVFTRDLATALRAYSRLDASAVMVNDHTAFRVDWMPFAGLRQSGLGVGGIPYTLHDMRIEKLFVGPGRIVPQPAQEPVTYRENNAQLRPFMSAPTGSSPPPAPPPATAWAPLRHATFRTLWGTWLTANLCMWMNDVAAAWLMTSLTTEPLMVALVQSASTLPVFLLGVPSGALADILDRRRYLIATQFWIAAVGVVLCLTKFTGTLNAPLLLVLTFANGIGLAMRWPVYAALVPSLVPRQELASAIALNGVAMNTSRVLGPVIAGAVIAGLGSAYVFLLNAVIAIAVGLVLVRWKHEQPVSPLPSERFFGAIRVGMQYIRQSPSMHAILLRIAVFFLQSMGLLALLPLVAKQLEDGGAGTYTVLLASVGIGAIVTALLLPRLRQFMTRDQLVRNGTLLYAAATLGGAFAPNLYVAIPGMLAAGAAWIAVANSLSVAAQMTLPDWVRARGMSVYQMAMMGGSAIGAALWGQIASLTDVRTSLVAAAITGVVGLAVTRRFKVGGRAEEDLTPVRLWKEPEVAIPFEQEQGPVLVTVEYRIDPARGAEFVDLMRESRRVWLRNGVLAWELFRDTTDPGRYIEYFVDESWVEYRRRQERVIASDIALRERKNAFHIGDTPPVVTRYIAEPVMRD